LKVRIGLEDKKIDLSKLILKRKELVDHSTDDWRISPFKKGETTFCEIDADDESRKKYRWF